jgi:SAM-dependent methyltransferase
MLSIDPWDRLVSVKERTASPLYEDYLDPQCTLSTLDIFAARRAIVDALKAQLGDFSGTLLDVGCGFSPYRSLVVTPSSRARKYIGLDVPGTLYGVPDLQWDGWTIPLKDEAVDCALATEVLEHCPDTDRVLGEVHRTLKRGGKLFLTVPFLWPLHTVPHDEYRFTPFSLERHLARAGFVEIRLHALGGWDASLAQMIALWVRRRGMAPWKRKLLSICSVPFVTALGRLDHPPEEFHESAMITGLWGTARKSSE